MAHNKEKPHKHRIPHLWFALEKRVKKKSENHSSHVILSQLTGCTNEFIDKSPDATLDDSSHPIARAFSGLRFSFSNRCGSSSVQQNEMIHSFATCKVAVSILQLSNRSHGVIRFTNKSCIIQSLKRTQAYDEW